ncbi:MAG: hypothetical protein MUF59_08410 [Candidatus Krumholzibacteria bacterium]|nr:hypothetical protein [Candidatus Krumholzibacteria bacterium]
MKTALAGFAALLFMSACAIAPGVCEVLGSGEAAALHSGESEAAALVPEEGGAAALLPDEGLLEGWKADGEVLLYSAGDLWEYINGSAETFLMYDFKGVAVKHYLNGSGSEIKIEIYEHGSPLMAFGIFSQYRSPDAGSLGFGNESFGDEYTLHFWKGRYYVKVYAYDEGPGVAEAMKQFAEAVESGIAEAGSIPEEVSLFPAEGLVANSVTYVTEGVMGSGNLPPAFIASYGGGAAAKIYLFTLDDAAKAAALFESYSGGIGAGIKEVESGGTGYGIAAGEAPYRGRVVVIKSGKRVAVLSGFGDQEGRAEALAAAMAEGIAAAEAKQ